MVKGQVTIKQDIATSVITVLTNACSSLESDVVSKLSSTVAPLVECGFIDSSLTKIKSQVETIASLEKQLIASVTSHMEQTNQTEDNLYNDFNNNSNNSGYNGYNGINHNDNDDVPIDQDDGKKVNADKLCAIIPTLDATSKINLFKVIKFYKDKDTNFIDLLLDTRYSEELYTLLKKAFGDALDLEEMSSEDIQKVQKVLLDTIMSKDVDISEFKENSILVAKEYLVKVCSRMNINPSNLFFDSEYRNTLKQALKNVYKGNVADTMTAKEIEEFKAYIDKICLKNNTTAEELIDNRVEILL